MKKEKVYIGIGSNLGNKEKNISDAIKMLTGKCEIIKTSSLYITEPVGFLAQDKFINGVILVNTNLRPLPLLEFLKSIEKRLLRVKTFLNGPRTIDLDILFYNNLIINHQSLIIPHPRLHERNFVLEPLNEISPNYIHPIFNKRISELMIIN